MNAGERIKIMRKSLGISAEYIADKIGVSPSTIYRYENNDIASMKIENLKMIADILGTKASYILGWYDEEPVTATIPQDEDSSKEKSLMTLFRQLNDDGQDKVCEYTSDLVASGRYSLDRGKGSGSEHHEEETA